MRTFRSSAVPLALVLVVATLALASCGDDAGDADSSDAATMSEPAPGAPDSSGSGVAAGEAGAERVTDGVTAVDPDAVDSGTPAGAGRSVIYTADLTVEVADTGDAVDAVREVVTRHGGWIFSESQGSTERPLPLDTGSAVATDIGEPEMIEPPATSTTVGQGAVVVAKLPPEVFDDALADLADLGEVRSRHLSASDVTAQVTDVEGRLLTAETSAARLRELLASAGDVQSLVAVEAELARREAEIESLQGQQRVLADQVELATVTISLSEPATEEAAAEPAGFTDGLGAGWDALVGAGRVVAITAGAVLPWLPLLVVLAAAGIALRRRTRRVQTVAGS